LILSASGIRGPEEIIRLAREMSSNIRVFVRTAYLKERSGVLAAGADLVFSEEGEVAMAMTEAVLRELGATPEQVDRERESLRADLFGGGKDSRAPGD
jgi:CPA2 family monovalent cation:H+ antiporter-2